MRHRMVTIARQAQRSAALSTNIETVGATARGQYGELARIVEVLEWTRLSAQHLTSPGDVVVRLEQVGLGFNHTSSWASDLTPAEPGDVGAHPEPDANGFTWHYVPASWRTEPAVGEDDDTCEGCTAGPGEPCRWGCLSNVDNGAQS
jgi:hypothetical protein